MYICVCIHTHICTYTYRYNLCICMYVYMYIPICTNVSSACPYDQALRERENERDREGKRANFLQFDLEEPEHTVSADVEPDCCLSS